MASNSSTNGQGVPPTSDPSNNRASRPIVPAKNPYATKRKRTITAATNQQQSQQSQSRSQQQQPSHHQQQPRKPQMKSPVAGMEGSTGFSFSQAFGEIEETEYYRTSVAESQQDHGENYPTLPAAERAQQRAFEEAAAAAGISDRDNHAFLQPHVLSVSTKQIGNGLLSYIRNGKTRCRWVVRCRLTIRTHEIRKRRNMVTKHTGCVPSPLSYILLSSG